MMCLQSEDWSGILPFISQGKKMLREKCFLRIIKVAQNVYPSSYLFTSSLIYFPPSLVEWKLQERAYLVLFSYSFLNEYLEHPRSSFFFE